MKCRLSFILPLAMLFVWGVLVSGGNNGALDAKVNTSKNECRKLLGDARYEGSKVTYYTLRDDKQTKSVEVFMFMTNEYVFAIDGKICSAPLTVKIFDAPAESKDRTLIKEFKRVNGTRLTVSSNELNTAYLKKNPKADKLKNLFVEYSIGSGAKNMEAIVMIYGSK